MLEWKSETNGDFISIHAKLEVVGDDQIIQDSLVDLWGKVIDLFSQSEDDILIVQFITQSGGICIYPSGKSHGERKDAKFFVDLTFGDWSFEYDALPDSEYNEEKFEIAYERLHRKQVSALRKSFKDIRIKDRFKDLKKNRKSFAVFQVDEAYTFVRDKMVFLWGNRPPRRDFSTSRELFEHIFRKASLFPEPSMRLNEDDEVVAACWSGHEFTDEYVELLDGVPGVSELCSDLRDLVIEVTLISPSGIDRLQNLLPNVCLTIVSEEELEDGSDPWHTDIKKRKY